MWKIIYQTIIRKHLSAAGWAEEYKGFSLHLKNVLYRFNFTMLLFCHSFGRKK